MASTLKTAAEAIQKLLELPEDAQRADANKEAMLRHIRELAEREQPPTVAELRESRVGNAVGAIARKCAVQECKDRASSLMKEWRSFAQKEQEHEKEGQRGEKRSAPEKPSLPPREAGQSTEDRFAQLEKAEQEEQLKLQQEQATKRRRVAAPPPATGANASERTLVRKRLAETLKVGGAAASVDESVIVSIAASCEDELWLRRHMSEPGVGEPKAIGDEAVGRRTYMTRTRSIIFNLKKNNDLRENVISGSTSGEELARMTPKEMASEDIKTKRASEAAYREEASMYREGGNRTRTTLFKCGKCGSRDTEYYLLQTRGADEPMTEFHNCVTCGHGWKC